MKTNNLSKETQTSSTSATTARRPSLKINALSNWVSLGVNIAIGFFLTPFIIQELGKTGYGIWTLIVSLIGYYGLLNLGVDSALIRYIALYAGQSDKKSLNAVASTAMVMFSCIGSLGIASLFLLAAPLATFFDVSPEHFGDFKQLIWIMGIAAGLHLHGSVFRAILAAHERFIAINFENIVTNLMRAGLTVFILQRGGGLFGIGCVTLVTTVFSIVASYLMYKHFVRQVRISFTAANWQILRILLVYGGITTVIAISNLMRTNLDSLVIGKWVGLPFVGVYAIAALIVHNIVRLISAGMNVLTPRFAVLYSTKQHTKLQCLFVRSLSISALLAFGAGMLVIIFGKHFIAIWVGEDYVGSVVILWILVVPYTLALSQFPGFGLMYALNKHRFFAVVTIIEVVVNVAISILLAP